MGCQLGQVLLKPWEVLRGSSKDLRADNFQLSWKNASRNCVGRRLHGKDFRQLGGKPGVTYRLGLNVCGMGNMNACDVAHLTHAGVLQSEGCLSDATTIQPGKPLPRGDLLEGLIIDDYAALHVVSRSRAGVPRGPDVECMSAAARAYRKSHL